MGSGVDDSSGFLGQSVRKYFEGYRWYDGKVTKFEEEDDGLVLFTVYYPQDGDEEQLEKDELLKVLVKDGETNEEKEDLPADIILAVSPGTEGRPSRRARRVVNYNYDYDSSEDQFANELKEKPLKKKQKRSKNTKKSQSQDDSEFEQDETLSILESESDDDSFYKTPAKKKRKASSNKKGKSSGKQPSGGANQIGKKSMVESW